MNDYITIGGFFLLILLTNSCGKTAADYAQQYCDCAQKTELSKATVQAKNRLITPQELSQIEKKHSDCMGEEDPLQSLQDSPEEYKQFQQDFLQALDKKCPNIARDMGF